MEIKYLTFILFFLLIGCKPSGDQKVNQIESKSEKVKKSKWYYYNSDSSDIFEIELSIQENGRISGKHVFTFNNGEKIDASMGNQASIKGNIKIKSAEVIWRSSFCTADSAKIKLIFQTDTTMLFKPLKGCMGEIGNEIIFKKQN